ncbi:MAG: hypothetical protein K0R38_7791 [Polyangiaceae bacterium]|nr:hypothetical protein [Polyangiaceae bacterium]
MSRSRPRFEPTRVALGCVLAALAVVRPARAEVPTATAAPGREFRVDFSARHLDVDAELGELSLSGDVEVTVGRYRLGGDRVKLKRGPRGIGVEGGGDIAFCSCDDPPVTVGYRAVTIAPPSDVLIEGAVLRAGKVPIFWLPYLWLRSPDRLALMFPSAEWRGDEGLLLGSGVHVPFDSNNGRPAARALDVGAYGYVQGGARVDAKLLTPETTSFVRWDHLGATALVLDAHGAVSGRRPSVVAYDVDASLGERGRMVHSSLEAASRRYDHARLGVASQGPFLAAFGLAADAPRAAALTSPLGLGPFALLATGGTLGDRTSYTLDLGASSSLRAGEGRRDNGEQRGMQRFVLESSTTLGPLLARGAMFQQGELLSQPVESLTRLRAGAGLSLSLPLLRRFTRVSHLVEPELSGRVERQYSDGSTETSLLATGGVTTALGTHGRGAAARLRVAGGVGRAPDALRPLVLASVATDARWLGVRLSGVADPNLGAAEGTARLRLGPRGRTNLIGYAEGRTARAPRTRQGEAAGDLVPRFYEQGALDREGLSTGADLTVALGSVLWVGGGADWEPLAEELLGVRGFARYRHACGCVALGAFGTKRAGRPGFDAGLSLDLMP